MSADEVFFDTNIIQYLLSPDATKADRAEELLTIVGMISLHVLKQIRVRRIAQVEDDVARNS